jgi:hypothetical protein
MSLTVRLVVSPWLHRMRYPIALAMWLGGPVGERLMRWAVARAVRVDEVPK